MSKPDTMNVRQIEPSPEIAGYVERILIIEDCQIIHPFHLALYPNGTPTLVFKSVKGKIKNYNSTYLTLFGQTVVPEKLTLLEDFTLIAYFFKPYALSTLFRITAKELTDSPIELNLLDSSTIGTLQDQLLNSPTTTARIHLLDNYICEMIKKTKQVDAQVKYAAEKLSFNYTRGSLVQAQQYLRMTERTFQRLFESHIGISPNLYRRICQFNAAFQQLNRKTHHKLSDIAFANGYADQSHFIRSFKEFTTITPSDYVNFGPSPES